MIPVYSICRRKTIPKEEEIESLLGKHFNNCADCSHEGKRRAQPIGKHMDKTNQGKKA